MSDSTPVQENEAHEKAGKDQHVMLNAADELFENCEAPTMTLAGGRVIQINAAKVKQIREMTMFISEFFASLDSDAILAVIGKVSQYQQEQINQGVSPYALGTIDKVKDLLGNAGVISSILLNGMERLPKLVPMFTDMSAEDFEELDIDEGFLVAFHILGRNYAFFTQRCVPVIRAYFALLQSRKPNQGKQSKNGHGANT